ncbi:MAG: hypothetical protein MZV64_53220 [Ignavibacteriales bacterium]|nr:hypothetical protein [Ignavibacteriales bacterium]
MNWDFFEMPATGKSCKFNFNGLDTERRYCINMGWVGYNEALFLYILAAGSGMTNVEAAYKSMAGFI